MSTADRFLAWLVTGPLGRLYAFFADLTSYAVRRLLRRPLDERQR